MIRVAINGFGRIGRNFLRAVFSQLAHEKTQDSIEIVAINIGPNDPESVAYTLRYDSVMGHYPGSVEYKNGMLIVDGHPMKVIAETDPALLPWRTLKIDWVVECTGLFTHRADAQKHIDAGAQRVLISAPGRDVDCSIIPGVNDSEFNPQEDTIVSLGSCTTNALMPILKVITQNGGLESALVITTHAYTPSQKLLDGNGGKDPRKDRAAAINIIPTSTGSSRMVEEIMPELKGKVLATAVRVPVAKVSLLDVTWISQQPLDIKTLESMFARAAKNNLKGILAVEHEKLVSSDYAGNSHSVVVDMNMCFVQGSLAKVCGWYDNEWAYSVRLKDFLVSSKN